MRKDNLENHGNGQDDVELSRRSFFGRLALGAVLSIAMPGVVNAAKSATVKADKNHRLAKTARSAVRLPKREAAQASKVGRQTAKLNKSAGGNNLKPVVGGHGSLHAAHSERNMPHESRVRDIYTGKKHHVNTASYHANRHGHQGGRSNSIIQPAPRETFIESSQDSLFLADRGRFATHRALAFQNPHTGDKLSLTYFERGRYLSDALNEISFLLRDYRTDDVHPIDPELLDQLHDLKQMLGLNQPFDVICGYRSPLTNAKLHAENSGVANNSFHMHGRAVDIRIERFDLRRIHSAALAMHRGGVGYYPESNFIHLDTGTFRTWKL
jgi:uncharacterized protein YcbK (DUF882 family)